MTLGFMLAFSVPLAVVRLHIGEGVVTSHSGGAEGALAEGQYGPCVVASRSSSCPFDRSDPSYSECWASSPTGPSLTVLVWALGVVGLLLLVGGIGTKLFVVLNGVYRRARSGGS
jgi:hypothetical protein